MANAGRRRAVLGCVVVLGLLLGMAPAGAEEGDTLLATVDRPARITTTAAAFSGSADATSSASPIITRPTMAPRSRRWSRPASPAAMNATLAGSASRLIARSPRPGPPPRSASASPCRRSWLRRWRPASRLPSACVSFRSGATARARPCASVPSSSAEAAPRRASRAWRAARDRAWPRGTSGAARPGATRITDARRPGPPMEAADVF